RRQMAELKRWEGGPGDGEGGVSRRVAEIKITIGQLDRKILRYSVGEARVQRPRKIPLAGVACVRIAAATACCGVNAGREIAEIRDRVTAEAHAGADERRDVVPSAEVDVAVQQERPFVLAGRVAVDDYPAGIIPRRDIQPVEICAAAVFASDIETQPVIEV